MAHASGINGAVYSNNTLVEDCEDAWNEQVIGGCTSSTTTGKVGTNAARVTTVGIGATTVLESEVIALDLTAYDAVMFWARSSLSPSAGNLELLLDDTADCASPLENLDLPGLTAATWRQCFAKLSDPSLLGSLISIGLYQVIDLADGTFDLDDVRALAEIDGIKSWTLTYTTATLDTTDFADSGVSSFTPGITEWNGTFEGYKDGVPLSIGSEIYLVLGETDTAYQAWLGKAIISSVTPVTDHDGLVSYSYTFQGTGELQVPDA